MKARIASVSKKLGILFAFFLFSCRAFASSGFSDQGGGPITDVYGSKNDIVSLTASASLTQDSNLFRLAGTANPAQFLGTPDKSDTITGTTLGVSFDKSYSMQSIKLQASVTNNRYNKFRFLDYNNTSVNALWSWTFTPRLTGGLSYSRAQTLNNFAYYQTYVRNLNTTDNINLDGDWWFGSRWHALFGLSESSSNNSAQTTLYISSKTTGANVGMKYESSPGNSITFKVHDLRGSYPGQPLDYVNVIDNGFRQQEAELDFSWVPTGRSSLNGRLTYMKRLHDHFSQRNISALYGTISYDYLISDKTSLNLSANRTISPYFATNQGYLDGNGNTVFVLNSNYLVQNDLSIQPVWSITSKTSMRMVLDYGTEDYKGSVVPNPGPEQHDTTRSLNLELNWAPKRYLSLSSSLGRTNRRSNNSFFTYDDTIASISARLLLSGDF
ncbi:MAG TPA: putative exosortase B-associated extracellular polysaccharide biosynthesis transporter EpsL [Burkholderiales bacterium]|nr:putative exosortase B-associated extracellular polysaccharide biosynthesis transporter EpsL [Burkholderiales bacterium]